MTPIDQNRAIAEWCGWRDVAIRKWGASVMIGVPPNKKHSASVPDYHTDLNSMHSAESRLTEAQKVEFMDWLLQITIGGGWTEFDMIHATAADRCQALLRTLKLWRDE